MPGPELLSLRKLGFGSIFLLWSSGHPDFLHGLSPGSNLGQAQIEEIFKFLAKTGAPRCSSPRSPDSEPGARPTALRWAIYIQVGGLFHQVSIFRHMCAKLKKHPPVPLLIL